MVLSVKRKRTFCFFFDLLTFTNVPSKTKKKSSCPTPNYTYTSILYIVCNKDRHKEPSVKRKKYGLYENLLKKILIKVTIKIIQCKKKWIFSWKIKVKKIFFSKNVWLNSLVKKKTSFSNMHPRTDYQKVSYFDENNQSLGGGFFCINRN
jgi:hypothetical protein